MMKTNYYQMPEKSYKSSKSIGRALEEVYADMIHVTRK